MILDNLSYTDTIFAPHLEQTERADILRVKIERDAKSGSTVYTDFKKAIESKVEGLEKQLEDIRNMVGPDIVEALEKGEDLTQRVTSGELRAAFNAFYAIGDKMLGQFAEVAADAGKLQTVVHVVLTAEEDSTVEPVNVQSAMSMLAMQSLSGIIGDANSDSEKLKREIDTLRADADSILERRVAHEKKLMRDVVIKQVLTGAGTELDAPQKAAFTRKKPAPRP